MACVSPPPHPVHPTRKRRSNWLYDLVISTMAQSKTPSSEVGSRKRLGHTSGWTTPCINPAVPSPEGLSSTTASPRLGLPSSSVSPEKQFLKAPLSSTPPTQTAKASSKLRTSAPDTIGRCKLGPMAVRSPAESQPFSHRETLWWRRGRTLTLGN